MFRSRLERFKTACESSDAYVSYWLFGAVSVLLIVAAVSNAVGGWRLHGDLGWYFWIPTITPLRFPPLRYQLTTAAAQTVALGLFTLWATPSKHRTELLAEGVHPDLRGDQDDVN
ncbi:hypothetical protein [Natronorubrum daqingense]|uniref:Uncharacterized protein n=1 Tax=Natronorubrum daqingense TaxID=588898 RepID=A0A1N7FXN1_9EURY|nr:hypothetical protein [Natronorubrum daqingense]APX98534.1 hypothetical protein BB347_17655 [Natronorubrum daqingense]SIS04996.1 hypothetical protein SAMN05421809_3538 [Natronorubrum daqingense]